MMDDLLVGQRIKAYRLRAGISQETLAEKTGLSLRTIQRIENEETQPRGDSLLSFSQLAFILFPGLGIVAPLLFWVMKREEIAGVNEVGRQILNFQITWLLVLVIFVCFVFWQGGDGPLLLYPLAMALFYGFNLVLTIVNAIRASKGKHLVYPSTIPFIRA
jgi:uncharacterized Tic20 family protein